MTETLEQKRQEALKQCQIRYDYEVKSCIKEIHNCAINNPTARTVRIRRRKTSDEFKIALSRACAEENMVATFGWFGIIEVWLYEVEYYVALKVL